MTGLAAGSSHVLQHLLLDLALKTVIVLAALGVLALGMKAIWRRTPRPPRPPRP